MAWSQPLHWTHCLDRRFDSRESALLTGVAADSVDVAPTIGRLGPHSGGFWEGVKHLRDVGFSFGIALLKGVTLMASQVASRSRVFHTRAQVNGRGRLLSRRSG